MSSYVIHEQKEPQMKPLNWVVNFELCLLGMLLGIAVAIGPLAFVFLWPSIWTMLSLLAIPLGVLVFVKILKHLRELIWMNNHRNQHVLYDDRVEYQLWNHNSKVPVEGSVRIADIREIYYGRYVFYYSQTHNRNQQSNPNVVLMPVLFLVYKHGLEDRALAVPFTDVMDANRWLEVIGGRDIPLMLSALLVHDFYDESVPQLLREDEDAARVQFEGNIDRQYRPFLDQLIEEAEQEEQRELTDEELDELELEMKRQEYEQQLKRRRSPFRGVGLPGWLVFPLQFGVAHWLMNLAVAGTIDPSGIIFPALLLIVFNTIFLLLVKWMHWGQMLIYPVLTFLSFVFLDLSDVETSPAYQVSSVLLAMSLMSPIMGIIIFFGVKVMRKNRDQNNLPQAPAIHNKTVNSEDKPYIAP
ncbi:hypothetical protein JCM10914A_16230 [Paenibacillus sp. JCM 10914]|uniref:hypothetical protein n=1 Tax=Paenibacillus sp. JCM 10914 TaxID=1236974 RepID=UPI0003CC6401|nr:hypothetical protein [Paenibacillus sp. JCM 10914]GAE06725.1 hypothetical protein JCM10914_2898 [Paenibacillus sp. JCM 10914]